MKRTGLGPLFAIACMMIYAPVGRAQDASANPTPKPSKQALFNVIARGEDQYYGQPAWPEALVSRWRTKLLVQTIAPGSEAVATTIIDSVISPMAKQVTDLHLTDFPGVELETKASKPTILIFVGDALDPLIDQSPLKDLAGWNILFGRARDLSHRASCVKMIGSLDRQDIVAAIVFISTKQGSFINSCAAEAFADVLGLRGYAPAGASVKSVDGFERLQPLDEEALRLLYGNAGETKRLLTDAIDAYLSQQ